MKVMYLKEASRPGDRVSKFTTTEAQMLLDEIQATLDVVLEHLPEDYIFTNKQGTMLLNKLDNLEEKVEQITMMDEERSGTPRADSAFHSQLLGNIPTNQKTWRNRRADQSVTAHRKRKKAHECEICKKKFSCPQSLNVHLLMHKRQNVMMPVSSNAAIEGRALYHTCPTCGTRLTSKSSLARHNRDVHIKNKRIKCNKCDKDFSTRGNLQAHQAAVHMKLKPFKCSCCEKSFSKKTSMMIHIAAVHKKVKDLQCTECGLKFARGCALEEHKNRAHLKLRKFDCDECEKKFYTRENLKTHVEAIHKRYRNFSCDECGETFYTIREKYDHSLRKHRPSAVQTYRCQLSLRKKIVDNRRKKLKFRVYIVNCPSNQLLRKQINREGCSSTSSQSNEELDKYTRSWMIQKHKEGSKTIIPIYVGKVTANNDKTTMSKYHFDKYLSRRSSIAKLLKKNEHQGYRVHTIECKTKKEMEILESVIQEFIMIRYQHCQKDPAYTGLLFEPMWSQPSSLFLLKLSPDQQEMIISIATETHRHLFCLDDSERCMQDYSGPDPHRNTDEPFSGLLHISEAFDHLKIEHSDELEEDEDDISAVLG